MHPVNWHLIIIKVPIDEDAESIARKFHKISVQSSLLNTVLVQEFE